MKLPVQITSCDIPPSPNLVSHIQKKAEKLDHFYSNIMSCRVVIKLSQKHQHNGKLFCVNIDITVPSQEFAINKIHNEDAYVAVRDAFNAAQRKLKSFARKRRGDIKNHISVTDALNTSETES